jgi:chromate transporter
MSDLKPQSVESAQVPPDIATLIPLREFVRVWWKIGWLSFGGPAAQMALMHRTIVEERRWISDARYMHALQFAMLLPGPEAQQLATWLGWVVHGTRGALVAGGLFILPGALVMFVLASSYVLVGQIPVVQSAFTGLQPVMIVIVLEAIVRISRRSLTSTGLRVWAGMCLLVLLAGWISFPALVAISLLTGLLLPGASRLNTPATTSTRSEAIIDRYLDAGALPHAHRRAGRSVAVLLAGLMLWLTPIVALMLAGAPRRYIEIATTFATAAVVTFGGAYSVLAWVSQQAVDVLHWVTPAAMFDALALAETTPGPLILVVQFIGFLAGTGLGGPWFMVHGLLAGLLTLYVTFVPSFTFVLAGAPHIDRLRHLTRLRAALALVSGAVVAVVARLGFWFATHAWFADTHSTAGWGSGFEVPVWSSAQPWSIVLTVAAAIALFRFHVSLVWLLVAGAGAGVLLSLAGLL